MKLLLLSLLLLSSCSYRVEKEPSAASKLDPLTVTFAEVQAFILLPKCAKCHGAMMRSYQLLQANLAEISARIQSNDQGFIMPPPGEAPLTNEERAALIGWISRGAPEGQSPAPSVPEPPPATEAGSFAFVQQKVLLPKCSRCHSAMVNSYEEVVFHLAEIESRVRSTLAFEQMPPPRASQLTEEEKELLLDWIKAGAPLENETER